MNTQQKRNLLKLARHLLVGKLAHKRFDFEVWNGNWWEKEVPLGETNVCGTSGCAIGECPAVFPKNFVWDKNNVRSVKGDWSAYESIIYPDEATINRGVPFFGLDEEEAKLLFSPRQPDGWYELEGERAEDDARLPSHATRYDVAKHIINFVNKKTKRKVRLSAAEKEAMAKATLC